METIMRIFATIAEYNPFHNGHVYHIEQMKSLGADAIVAVMSGNFVQRAEPAIVEKYARANAAVKSGVDLVLELPVRHSIATAEKFAEAGIYLINALGCIDTFCCGSELNREASIQRTAEILQGTVFNNAIKKQIHLSPEISFAKVRENILHNLGVFAPIQPNDILAVEYAKAIKKFSSPLHFKTIKRVGTYHMQKQANGFLGAEAIRKKINQNGVPYIKEYVPAPVYETIVELEKVDACPANIKYGERALIGFMRTMTPQILQNTAGATDGLWQRVMRASKTACSIEELYTTAKTKRFALSAIRRLVFSAFLTIQKADILPAYIRVLAMNKHGAEILSIAKKTTTLPIIHTFTDKVCHSGIAKQYAQEEIHAGNLYGLFQPQIGPCYSELTTYKKLL